MLQAQVAPDTSFLGWTLDYEEGRKLASLHHK